MFSLRFRANADAVLTERFLTVTVCNVHRISLKTGSSTSSFPVSSALAFHTQRVQPRVQVDDRRRVRDTIFEHRQQDRQGTDLGYRCVAFTLCVSHVSVLGGKNGRCGACRVERFAAEKTQPTSQRGAFHLFFSPQCPQSGSRTHHFHPLTAGKERYPAITAA